MPRIIGSSKNKLQFNNINRKKALILFLLGQATNVSGVQVGLPANEGIYIGIMNDVTLNSGCINLTSGSTTPITSSTTINNQGFFAGITYSDAGFYINNFNSGDYVVISANAIKTQYSGDATKNSTNYLTYNTLINQDGGPTGWLPIASNPGLLIIGGALPSAVAMYVGEGQGTYTIAATGNSNDVILATNTASNGSINVTGNSAISTVSNLLGSYNIINNNSITRTDAGTVIDMTNANLGGTINITNNGTITAHTGSKAIDFTGAVSDLNLVNNNAAVITGNIVGGNSGNIFNIYGGTITGNITGGTGTNVLNVGSTTATAAQSFSTSGTINQVQTINVVNATGQTTSFSINNPITNVNSSFTTNTGTTTNVNANGVVSGSGTLTNSGALILNSGGTIGIPTTFGVASGATFTINGGTIVSPIFGYSKTDGNTVTIAGNFTTGNTIDSIGAIMVSEVNSVPTVFTVNNPITNVINHFEITDGSSAVIGSGGSISGCSNLLINSGTLTLNPGGVIASSITFGSTSLSFGSNPVTILTVNGGTITGTITGNFLGSTNTVNVTGTFTTGNTINNIGTIAVSGVSSNPTVFMVNNPITNLATSFTTGAHSTTIIDNGGSISGSGTLTNSGALVLNPGGSISTPITFGVGSGSTLTINGGTLTGTITGNSTTDSNTVNVGGTFTTGNTIDKVGNISVSGVNVDPTIFTVNNSITNISNGFTIDANSKTVIGGTGVVVSGGGTLTNSGALTVNSGGSVELPISFGVPGGASLTINGGLITTAISGNFGIDNNTININSDFTTPSTISQVGNISVFETDAATPVTFTVNKAITNTAILTIGANATLDINSGGDISGVIAGGAAISNLGTLSINSGGTIGSTAALGDVVNNGTFIASGGGVVKVGAFLNNSLASSPTLSISSGNMTVAGTVTNTLGGITISGTSSTSYGDLSSASASTPSNLINGSDQTITVSGFGTMGHGATLGNITNNGIITNAGTIKGVTLTNSGDIISSGNSYFTGNITNNNNGIIAINSGGNFGKNASDTTSTVNLTNSGSLINHGTLKVSSLTQSGIMVTDGTINVDPGGHIAFGTNSNNTLTIKGGTVNSSIIGGVNNVIEINVNPNSDRTLGTFTTGGSITGVGAIKLDAGNFVIENAITGVANNFTTAAGTTTTINATTGTSAIIGSLTGVGTINNGGSITLNNSASTLDVGTFINNNTNATLTIQAGRATTSNIANTLGRITISGGDLSSQSSSTPSRLTNAATISLSEGTVGANNALGTVLNQNTINVSGGSMIIGDFINNNANANLNITGGVVQTGNIINTLGAGNTTSVSSTTSTTNPITSITISNGDLSSASYTNKSILINQIGQVITISGTGTVGATVGTVLGSTVSYALGAVTNYGTINAGGASMTVGTFTNNNANAVLNITNGSSVLTGNITNTLGAISKTGTTNPITSITISNGDLSSVDPTNKSTLTNAVGQVITISGIGTMGYANQGNNALGAVTNYGTINAGGSNITVGTFTNNNANAVLNITNGPVETGDINNTLGSILISGSDLSSAGITASNLTNAAGQTITISEQGSMGNYSALGTVNNNGTINVGGNGMMVGDFTNNHANAALKITGSTTAICAVETGVLTNTLGSISISGGAKVTAGNIINTSGSITISGSGSDLSSTSYTNRSTLQNAASQTISVSAPATMGAATNTVSYALGAITNYGTFNINYPVINTINSNLVTAVGNFTNETNALVNLGANIDIGGGGGTGYTFINNGTVNVLQPVNLNGNYTNSGTHIVTIDGNGNPSVLNLGTGSSVTLNNNATISIQLSGDPLIQDQQSFPIITASSANITGNVNFLGGTNLISYAASINNNNILITATRKSIVDIIGTTTNSGTLTVAKVLDGLFKTGITNDLKIALAKIEELDSTQDIINVITQLSPETNITPDTGFIAPSMALGMASERLDLVARAGINNIQTGFSAGGMQSNNGLWIKGLGGTIQQKQYPNSSGYNANTAGFAFGVDRQILDDTWLGLGLSSVGTHVSSKDFPSKKTNINSRQITVYSSFSPGDYYIDHFTAIAFNSYNLMRSIKYNGLNYTATAKYSGIQPSSKISAGFIHGINNFKIIPNCSVQYSVLGQKTYNEVGAGGLSLQQTNSTLNQLEGGVGIKFALLHNENSEQIFNPDLHFMVLRDFKSSAPITTAKFLGGGGSFTIQGATPDKTTYNVGAGLIFIHENRVHFTANYELRKKNKFIGHSGSLAVRYEI